MLHFFAVSIVLAALRFVKEKGNATWIADDTRVCGWAQIYNPVVRCKT